MRKSFWTVPGAFVQVVALGHGLRHLFLGPAAVAQQEDLSRRGVEHVQVLGIRERTQSLLSENLDLIRNANWVMFSGGNQSKITEIIGGSTIHKILMERYEGDKLVIAGKHDAGGFLDKTNKMMKVLKNWNI